MQEKGMMSWKQVRKIPVWGIALLLLTGMGAVRGEESAPRLALQFDGKNDHLVASLGNPLDGDLTLEAWMCTSADVELQERIVALSTADQGNLEICINNGRLVINDSGGLSKRGLVGPGKMNDGRWHHVVIKRYEKTTYALHVDGLFIDECPGTTPIYTALYIGTAPGQPRFNGLVDEVRLYNRCLTNAEVTNNYTGEKPLAREGLVGWWQMDGNVKDAMGNQDGQVIGAPKWVPGRGKALYDSPRIDAVWYPGPGKVGVDIDSRMMGDFPADAAWEAELRKPTGEMIEKQTVTPIPATRGTISFSVENIPLGQYQVQVRVLDSQKKTLGQPATAQVSIDQRPEWIKKVRILNNLVWELLSVPQRISGNSAGFTFTNPRDGWVFFSAASAGNLGDGDRVETILDTFPANKCLFVHKAGNNQTQEAIRYLPAGKHTLTISLKGKAALKKIVARRIPTIIFEEYLQNHNFFTKFAPRNLEFMKHSGLLDNVTTLQMHGEPVPHRLYQTWSSSGRHWTSSKPIGDGTTAEALHGQWLSLLATNPWLDGISIDEFMQFNPLRNEAVKNLLSDPRLENKHFYPFCCSPHPSRGGEDGVTFLRLVTDAGHLPLWERYLQEPPDEASAWSLLDTDVRNEVKNLWQKVSPEPMSCVVMCFGNYLSTPPENLNVNPSIDFKVWMDIQYNLIANDPLFFGQAGLMEYTSGYADEEVMTWSARLYRHYAIEGHTEMLSPKYGFRFRLTHIRNPDFDDGLSGWNVQAAEQDSVAVRKMVGYSALQGRYPATSQGENFLVMKRSSKGANRVSQPVKNLTAGKLYSLKLMGADYGELTRGEKSEKKRLPVTVTLDGIDILTDKSFVTDVCCTSAGDIGKFNSKNPLWHNYYYLVFRAKTEGANLTISDEADGKEPGGPVGQEILFNFAELQPYYGGDLVN